MAAYGNLRRRFGSTGHFAARGLLGTPAQPIATRVVRRAVWHRERDTRKSRKPFPVPSPSDFPKARWRWAPRANLSLANCYFG
jgi:hypothetical protein